ALKNYKDDDSLSDREQVFVNLVELGVTEETVDTQYDILQELDANREYESEFRCGQVVTKLPSDFSRHYEAKEVAAKLSDGSWVGWTYWYGGGKHGDPGSIDGWKTPTT